MTPPRQLHLLSLWFLFAVVTVYGMVLIQCCHPEPKTPNTTFHSITDLYVCYVFWLGSREKKALQRRPFAVCAEIEHIPNLRIRPPRRSPSRGFRLNSLRFLYRMPPDQTHSESSTLKPANMLIEAEFINHLKYWSSLPPKRLQSNSDIATGLRFHGPRAWQAGM